MKIAVIDYGAGNVENVVRAFQHLSIKSNIVSRPDELESFSHVVIPGVGAFDFGMEMLRRRQLDQAITSFVGTGKPVLGICLGMHLLADLGHENGLNEGLHLIRSTVKPLDSIPELSINEIIPHTGWGKTFPSQTSNEIFNVGGDYYFAHSFYFDVADRNELDSYVQLGQAQIPASVKSENVMGVQFHPEKSGTRGLELLQKFLKM